MHISVLSMHWSLLFLQKKSINAVILMLCSCFHCMYTEILSQRWRDTALFAQCGLTYYFEIPLPTFTAWIMETVVILRWEFFALCKLCWALHRWTYKWQIQMHISVLSMRWSLLFLQSINSDILMLRSFFHCMYTEGLSQRWRDTALFAQCRWTCYFEIPCLTTWIMEPAVVLNWEIFAYCVNSQALRRWALSDK